MFSEYFFQWILPSGQSFSQMIVLVYLVFRYFFNRFCFVERCGVTLHSLYHDSLTANHNTARYIKKEGFQKQ